MKKAIVVGLVVLCSLTAAIGQERVSFESKEHDFGVLKLNEEATCTFEFTNISDKPVAIKSATAASTSMTFSYSGDTVMPGGKGVITIHYTPDRTGRFFRSAAVSISGSSFLLIVRGEVIHTPPTPRQDTIPVQRRHEDTCATLISREVDKFSGEITFRGALLNNVAMVKVVKGATTSYYLRVTVPGHTVSVAEKGVYILFSDGSKFNKPSEPVDVDVSSGGSYEYSAFVRLTTNEVEIFRTKTIDAVRLYIYDKDINPQVAEAFRHLVSCMKAAK